MHPVFWGHQCVVPHCALVIFSIGISMVFLVASQFSLVLPLIHWCLDPIDPLMFGSLLRYLIVSPVGLLKKRGLPTTMGSHRHSKDAILNIQKTWGNARFQVLNAWFQVWNLRGIQKTPFYGWMMQSSICRTWGCLFWWFLKGDFIPSTWDTTPMMYGYLWHNKYQCQFSGPAQQVVNLIIWVWPSRSCHEDFWMFLAFQGSWQVAWGVFVSSMRRWVSALGGLGFRCISGTTWWSWRIRTIEVVAGACPFRTMWHPSSRTSRHLFTKFRWKL